MSFHVEWDRLARQAYEQIPAGHRLAVADAIIRLSHEGIPRDAEAGVG